MNPEFVKTKADQRRVRKEYINNLRLMASNEQKNYNANLILKETGQVPMEPLDARSLTEKKADIERLRTDSKEHVSVCTTATIKNTVNTITTRAARLENWSIRICPQR